MWTEDDQQWWAWKMNGYGEYELDHWGKQENKILTYTNIIDAIKAAIQDAICISNRIHVKAQKNQRVGIFVECLRKHIPSQPRSNKVIQSVLTDTAIWYDIGILEPAVETWRYKEIGRKRIEEWLDLAGVADPGDLELQESFDELNRSLAVMNNMVAATNEINTQGGKLIDELCEVFELGETDE